MTYNRLMKNKLSYLLGGFIGFFISYGLFYLAWIIFKRTSPEQAFISQTLFIENIFVVVSLILLAYPVEKILKSHKDRHQRYLNKLAEIEWIEQYGIDGKS